MIVNHYCGLIATVVVLLAVSCKSGVVCKAGLQKVFVENVRDKKTDVKTDAEWANRSQGVSYYEDEEICMTWTDAKTRLNFELKNKTDETMVLYWDSVRFVDHNGAGCSVIRSGVKYCEKEAAMEDSYIPAGRCLEDIILPSMNVYFNKNINGKKQENWIEVGLFPDIYGSATERKTQWQRGRWMRRTVRVLMPVSIKRVRKNYIFEFGIKPDGTDRLEKVVCHKRL